MVNGVSFDRQDAIEKATLLFWKKGYHATSMRNLQQVLDLRPGSIYASFGNKEGLFKEVLRCYTKRNLTSLKYCIETSSSPLAALKGYIEQAIVAGDEQSSQILLPNSMCLLVKTLAELTEENAQLLIESKRLLEMIQGAFIVLLNEAQLAGQITPTKDLDRLAHYVQMQITGLRIYAHTNDQAEVNNLINDLFKSIQS